MTETPPLRWHMAAWGWYADSHHRPLRYRVMRVEGRRFRLDAIPLGPQPRIGPELGPDPTFGGLHTSARFAKTAAAIHHTRG